MTSNIKISRTEILGNDVEYLEKGSGPLMLCLHGFPDHAHSFESFLNHFSDRGFHVVAPFMRGYGPALREENPGFTAFETSADASALLNQLTDQPAVVIGHDWGAAAAYGVALRAPEKLSHLVTLSVPYGGSFSKALLLDPEQQRRSWYMFFFLSAFAEAAVTANNSAFIDRLWQDWSPNWAADESYMQALKQTFAKPHTLKNALAYYRQSFGERPPVSDAYRMKQRFGQDSIQVKSLYLHGANDGCISPDLANGMDQLFPEGLDVRIIEQAGHFLHLEKSKEVIGIVEEFLGR